MRLPERNLLQSADIVSETSYQLLIDGAWAPGSNGTYPIVNPATEQVVAEAPEASVADAQAAAAAARAAQPKWAAVPAEEKARLLQAVADRVRAEADTLLPLIMAETGATVSVGSALQVPMVANRFERYARGARQDIDISIAPQVMEGTPLAPGGLMGAMVVRQPAGVVTCIAPYNFPMTSMAGKVAPALATGNAVVMKPAPQDPLAVIELARICREVGIPDGVVNVVTGSGPEVGAALVESPDVDMVSFTGSTVVGQAIYRAGAATMKRLLFELGGKGACLVFDDADLDAAVTALVSTWGFHSGQICTAPTRAVVQRRVYQEIVDRLAKAAPQLKVGPPTDPATIVGPVITGPHRDRVEAYVKSGVDEGAELVVGGPRPDFDTGYYVAPTLLAECTNQMKAVREEIFGPVIVVVPFDDEDEGIAIANDSDYGLYDYVYSGDTARGFNVAKQLRCGHVGVNTAQRNHEAPFGGFKQSGIGRDGGDFGLHAYTEMQSIIWPS
ncbi:MAG: NAD-dependent aldehyde dehydrogenase [Acidimicrobiales bacterium]|nr:NAD-dependent aldehyde dehydrogenase [Acidimicrobiales bacterium]